MQNKFHCWLQFTPSALVIFTSNVRIVQVANNEPIICTHGCVGFKMRCGQSLLAHCSRWQWLHHDQQKSIFCFLLFKGCIIYIVRCTYLGVFTSHYYSTLIHGFRGLERLLSVIIKIMKHATVTVANIGGQLPKGRQNQLEFTEPELCDVLDV